eukprot:315880_1
MSVRSPKTVACNHAFHQCRTAQRIKSILQSYNKIILNKTLKSDAQLQNETNDLVINLLGDEQYSIVELLNNFYHIKYDHNVNNDPHQFNLFYYYLFDNEMNTLQCDTNDCKSVKRYSNRRNRSFNCSQRSTHNDAGTYSLDLLCRIHTYFMHSYDMYQLTPDEIQYIERKLNEHVLNDMKDEDVMNDVKLQLVSGVKSLKRHLSNNGKYVTSDHLYLNYQKISIILKKNDIPIEAGLAGNLATAFDPYVYDQTQFISDLCDVMWQENDTDVLLAEILHKELNLSNQQTRTMIYELLLYKCVDKHELNNSNFIKILQTTARGLYPNIDCDAIATISHNEKLTGKLFIKGDPQFKNSLKFGKMFKSIDNWNKKQWANIYITMNKWQSSHTALTTAAPISSSSSVSNQQLDSTVMIEDIDKGTDLQHIQEFCAITRSTENVAIHFLKESEWNVTFAVNRYYATNCDDAIPQNNMNDNHEDSTR